MIDSIIVLVAVFYAGFQIGSHYVAFKLRHLIIREAVARGLDVSELIQPTEQPPLHLTIERHQNCLYLFDSKNNVFICQGNTIEDLAKFAKKYKNINQAYALDSDNNKMFKFVDGKVV